MERRTVLAAGLGAAVLSACTRRRRTLPPSPSSTPTPSPVDPDVAVLLAWAASETRLAGLYAPLLRSMPGLAALRDNHTVRATTVTDHLAARTATTPSPVAVEVLRGGVPTLVMAERAAALAYLDALAGVADVAVAVLGAELAAGARQQATVLRLATA